MHTVFDSCHFSLPHTFELKHVADWISIQKHTPNSFDILYRAEFGSVFGGTIVKQCIGFNCLIFFQICHGLVIEWTAMTAAAAATADKTTFIDNKSIF